MFLRQEEFATVVRCAPLISIDLLVENARGEYLLGQRLNRPAQGLWFVPGGRVQKDERLEDALERLTLPLPGRAEFGARICKVTRADDRARLTTLIGRIAYLDPVAAAPAE